MHPRAFPCTGQRHPHGSLTVNTEWPVEVLLQPGQPIPLATKAPLESLGVQLSNGTLVNVQLRGVTEREAKGLFTVRLICEGQASRPGPHGPKPSVFRDLHFAETVQHTRGFLFGASARLQLEHPSTRAQIEEPPAPTPHVRRDRRTGLGRENRLVASALPKKPALRQLHSVRGFAGVSRGAVRVGVRSKLFRPDTRPTSNGPCCRFRGWKMSFL